MRNLTSIKTSVLLSAFLLLGLQACKKDNTAPDSPIRPVQDSSSPYVTQLIEYLPAPGQFINKAPGDYASAQSIIATAGQPGSGTGLVSLGAWGGSITLGFDHTVVNQNGKEELLIQGNGHASFAEPGVVWVMFDENGNGLADDIWYELAGSEQGQPGYLRDYAVTYFRPQGPGEDVSWEDNRGNSGSVKAVSFHTQNYYPEWIQEDQYTLTGSLLPERNIDKSNPLNIQSFPLDFGYADNQPEGDRLSIANAVDENGNKVNLPGIDFIKIQTGIQQNLGWLGELSTEIRSVADLSLLEQ